MKSMLSYKNYYGTVEYCDVDNILYGKLLGLDSSVSYHGESAKELKDAFVEAVDDYISWCEEKGKQKPSTNEVMADIYKLQYEIASEFLEKIR